MKRRSFITAATLATTALPTSYVLADRGQFQDQGSKELYELRTYEIRLGGNLNMLKQYLQQALKPAFVRKGVTNFMMFNELGDAEPRKLWVVISYPNAAVYMQCQDLSSDEEYRSASEAYRNLPQGNAIYNRISSSLLLAFDGLPQMKSPVPGASLFELRTYEGYSEDAVKRKIKMFNEGELDIFYRTKLNPVFFGEMIIGPYRPSLTYMINFKDMEEHDRNWEAFIKDPEWITMRNEPQYANTVSNTRKVFLTPINE